MAVVQRPHDPSPEQERHLPMSYEEFLAWAGEDIHAEWAAGEVIVFMPPSDKHQVVAGLFYALVLLFTRAFKLGEVRIAPLEMRAIPDGPAREPDVFFVTAEHRDRLTAQRLIGPADLVMEVISTESVARDRAEKFHEYQEAGVREYLLLDPRRGKERVDLYRLTEEGKYLAVLPDNEGRYHSTVLPGFWFHPSWFWQEPAPDPLLLLAEMAPAALQQALAALEARRRDTQPG